MGYKSRGGFGTGHKPDCKGCFLCQKENMMKCLYCGRITIGKKYCDRVCFEAGVDDIPLEDRDE